MQRRSSECGGERRQEGGNSGFGDGEDSVIGVTGAVVDVVDGVAFSGDRAERESVFGSSGVGSGSGSVAVVGISGGRIAVGCVGHDGCLIGRKPWKCG